MIIICFSRYFPAGYIKRRRSERMLRYSTVRRSSASPSEETSSTKMPSTSSGQRMVRFPPKWNDLFFSGLLCAIVVGEHWCYSYPCANLFWALSSLDSHGTGKINYTEAVVLLFVVIAKNLEGRETVITKQTQMRHVLSDAFGGTCNDGSNTGISSFCVASLQSYLLAQSAKGVSCHPNLILRHKLNLTIFLIHIIQMSSRLFQTIAIQWQKYYQVMQKSHLWMRMGDYTYTS